MKNLYKVMGGFMLLLYLLTALSCAKDDPNKPIQSISFSSELRTKDPSNGWYLTGSAVDSTKAMGKSSNQLYRPLAPPDNAVKAKVSVKFISNTMFSTNLADVIWFKNKVEIKRSVKEMKGIPNKELAFDFEETRPPGADELLLIVRPWRDQDGIITITGGQLEWLR